MATPTSNAITVSSKKLSGSYKIDSLLLGTKWGSASSTQVSLTYSFPGSLSYWSTSSYGPTWGFREPWNSIAPLTIQQQVAALSALNSWSNVANILFTQTVDTWATVGEIRFAWTRGGGIQSAQAQAYYPSTNASAGDIWLSSYQADQHNFIAGSYWYLTLIHELGHALGLKHSFQAIGLNRNVLPSAEDGYLYSVMSYSAFSGVSGSSVSFNPTTPMLYDIAAIQYLYGVNNSFQTGNDTYIFSQGQDYFQTIWDAGGVDTIVWNATTESARIDLRSGHFSDLGNSLTFLRSNGSFLTTSSLTVAIAFGVTIENATGGFANDILIGNDVSNVLNGRAGSDTLIGGQGNDIYVVDVAEDVVTENASEGTDSVRVAFMGSGTYVLSANVENASVTADSTITVNLTGNQLDNVLTGNAAANILIGGLGNDILDGGAGNDTLDGGAGTDRLKGGAGDDTYLVNMMTDVVNETITGSSGNDTVRLELVTGGNFMLPVGVENVVIVNATFGVNVTGNSLDNNLVGNAAANILVGGEGNDTLIGGPGNDTLDGGLGTADRVILSGNFDEWSVTRTTLTDTVFTRLGQVVTIRGVEVLNFADVQLDVAMLWNNVASRFDDLLTGTDTSDTINGLGGNDRITGLGGDDTLIGGAGSDILVGGHGNDSIDLSESTSANDFVLFAGGHGTVGTIARISTLGLDTITGINFGTSRSAVDILQFSAADFGIAAGPASRGSSTAIRGGPAANSDGNVYIVTTEPTIAPIDLNGNNSATNGAIVFVGASTGTSGVSVWFTTNEGAFSNANSVRIATLVGLSTANLNTSDVLFIA